MQECHPVHKGKIKRLHERKNGSIAEFAEKQKKKKLFRNETKSVEILELRTAKEFRRKRSIFINAGRSESG